MATNKTLTRSNASQLRAERDPADLAALESTEFSSAFDHVMGGEPQPGKLGKPGAQATSAAATNRAADSEPLDAPLSKPQPTIHEVEQAMAAKPATAPKRLSKPANDYLMASIEKASQAPSLKLRDSSPDYYTELASRAAMLRMAEAKVGLVEAFRLTLQATAIAGPVSVIRLLSDLQRQALWSATLDIQKDRKANRAMRHDTSDDPNSDLNRSDAFMQAERALRMQLGLVAPDASTGHTDGVHPVANDAPYGLDRERDPDYIAPLTEDEVIDALTELNAYLSTLLMSVVTDPNDRAYIKADMGVPYTTRVDEIGGERFYTPVYDVEEAINVQIEANRVSMEKRRRKQAEDAIKASSALFELLHGRKAPSATTDEPTH